MNTQESFGFGKVCTLASLDLWYHIWPYEWERYVGTTFKIPKTDEEKKTLRTQLNAAIDRFGVKWY